jgi:hypothetical protein
MGSVVLDQIKTVKLCSLPLLLEPALCCWLLLGDQSPDPSLSKSSFWTLSSGTGAGCQAPEREDPEQSLQRHLSQEVWKLPPLPSPDIQPTPETP